MNDMDKIKALVGFGNLGIEILAVRMLSLLALAGYIGLAFYVSFSTSWQGVSVCGILAIVTIAAFRAENHYREQPKESP